MEFNPSLVVLLLCFAFAYGQLEHSNSWYTDIPKFDAQRCPQKIDTLEVLPGVGFDNLNNKPMGQVLAVNFSKCSLTLDRKYLIPDFVKVDAMKTSHVQLFSELIDNWQNYTTMTSRTINVEASGSFLFGSISGSFSDEHQSIRKSMQEDKTVTVRAQLRHVYYRVRSEPDSQLHPRCYDRLLDIASHIQRNDSYMKTYLSQLFVRDFGTHYTTAVDAGAVIAQTDQISDTYLAKFSEDKSKVTAAASASFLGIISAGASFSTSSDKTASTQYIKNRKKSDVQTIGGPAFRINYTLNDWEDGLYNNLVPTDRAGDPIWYAITPAVFPELDVDTVQDLSDTVKEAVRQYYLHNVHRGCTDTNAKNFDPQANFNDGQCEPPSTNFTFGGVYQTCSGPADFCSKNTQANPMTGGASCAPPYKAQLVYSFYGPRVCTRHCHYFLFFRTGCDTTCTQGQVFSYWCYAREKVPQHSGYLFGGVYTDTTNNLVTGDKKCPKFFYKLKMVEGYVCVSDDYELGYKYSYPFAGFTSCAHGNPLAENQNPPKLQGHQNTLRSFFNEQKNEEWPKHCPKGYSQHLMQVSHGCEIQYCVQKGALVDTPLPPLQRPPYVARPVSILNNTLYLLTKSKHVLKKIGVENWVPADIKEESRIAWAEPVLKSKAGDGDSLSTGGTVAVTIVGTVVVAAVIWAVIVGVGRWRRNSSRNRERVPVATYTAGDTGQFVRREGPVSETSVQVDEGQRLL